MISTDYYSTSNKQAIRSGERGAALATAILMLGLLSAIAMTVLAVVSTESRVAGSDLKRTQAFYAAASGIEKMSSDFNALFARTSRPSTTSMNNIAAAPPDLSTDPDSRDFVFTQTIDKDEVTLAAMRATQNITTTGTPPVGANPTVTVPDGPLVGLTASVVPYILNTTVTSPFAQVNLERRMNNYLVPIFQFGMFSDEDMEIHPGPAFTFNGRVHANGNLYLNGNVTFLDKVTTASEVVRDVVRNGATHAGTVTFDSGTLNEGNTLTNCTPANANCASVVMGPNLAGANPLSPPGFRNPNWKTNSVARYSEQLLTSLTGVAVLKLPLQLDGNPTRDIIKRRSPNDDETLRDSRYHTKSEIRILIDDENVTTDAARSNASPLNGDGTTNAGVNLSTFTPSALPNVLQKVADGGTQTTGSPIQQQQQTSFGTTADALTVRGVYPAPPHISINGATNVNNVNIIIATATPHGFVTGELVFIENVNGQTRANNFSGNATWTATNVDATHFSINRTGTSSSTNNYTNGGIVYSYTKLQKSGTTIIPPGAGLSGHILIQIVAVATDGTTTLRDVTQAVLSMGVTEGEPNGIVYMQRPLWMAYTQGARDANAANGLGPWNLEDIMADSTRWRTLAADGQIATPSQDTGIHVSGSVVGRGYLTNIPDDGLARADNPWPLDPANFTSSMWNSIVPINVYNVREGRLNNSLGANTIFERGMTSVVEINMKNLARWMDSAYDANVLAGTGALSANIGSPDGYIVYISDRRGDLIKSEVDSTNATVTMTNGMADNEEIYAPFTGTDGDVADVGEDVIDFKTKKGTLQKDVGELPAPANLGIILPNNTAAGATFTASTTASNWNERFARANIVNAWTNIDWTDTAVPKTRSKYFRRAVRLFNGEDLRTGNVTGRLSAIKGITMASENMLYIWGNYNTSGINEAPGGSTSSLNDSTEDSRYCPGSGSGTACTSTTDRQVPTSIVCDAFFPLSKTWFDGTSALFPDDEVDRPADRKRPNDTNAPITSETSVRAGIIAGNNLSALSATAAGGADVGNWSATADNNESRLNGGMHNFPRFLEAWGDRRFNFVGSLIPLFHSSQAMGQYGVGSVYSPPTRNWAFDITFRQSDRLPPGTPQFQYVEPTAFRQIMF